MISDQPWRVDPLHRSRRSDGQHVPVGSPVPPEDRLGAGRLRAPPFLAGVGPLNREEADRVGFEPTLPRRVNRFSRPAPSATRPPVQVPANTGLSVIGPPAGESRLFLRSRAESPQGGVNRGRGPLLRVALRGRKSQRVRSRGGAAGTPGRCRDYNLGVDRRSPAGLAPPEESPNTAGHGGG
jgi:hypothetical protein